MTLSVPHEQTETDPVDAILFDFDGVILDTVLLKEQAFREIMTARAPDKIDAIMEYFWNNGGTSRLAKFRWIYTNLLGQPPTDELIDELGTEFTDRVYDLVVGCSFINGAQEFLTTYHQRWPCYVISGTPQTELRGIVNDRGIGHFFKGVYGSPRQKVEIGNEIIETGGYDRNRVWFVGDATTDRDAANALGVRFVGIHGPHLTPYVNGSEIMIDDLRYLADVLAGQLTDRVDG